MTDIAVRHAVFIAIELQAQIFMDKRFGCVPVVVRNDGQRPERLWLKALCWPLPGFPMQSLVGYFGQPLAHLPVDIVQIFELPHGPEVLSEITD